MAEQLLFGAHLGDDDAWVARYDSLGNQTWAKQLGTSVDDSATAVASDGVGGAFVCGFTYGNLGAPSAGNAEAWLMRFDAAGSSLWTRQLGTSGQDIASAVAPDGAAGVFVAGNTDGSLGGPNVGGTDAWLARYSDVGALLWTRQFGTTAAEFTSAAAADGSGGAYVCGSTSGDLDGTNAGASDAFVARFDAQGTQLWVRQLGTDSGDQAYAACGDGLGGVFVAGMTGGALGGPLEGVKDAWVAHYSGNGALQWVRQLGTNVSDIASGLAPDGSGGAYLTGSTGGSLAGASSGGNDVWLAHVDSAGVVMVLQQLGSASHDSPSGAAPDGVGGVFLTGQTSGDLAGPSAGAEDCWVARLDGTCDGWGIPYCVGAANSTGQGASIGYSGSASLANNDLVLEVAGCPSTQVGIFIMGQFQTQTPFGDGWLCLSGNVYRLLPGLLTSQGGAGSQALDYDDTGSPASLIAPGSEWQFQFWYRDALSTGSPFNLSDALSVHFCP